MSTTDPRQWRIPTEDELGDFRACCWPTDLTVQFPCESLSPSEYALRLYRETGQRRMVNIDEESYAASVHSDYVTREEEEAGVRAGSPRKKARSIKDKLTDMHISESPIRPKRRALLRKVAMTLPEPLQMGTNRSLSKTLPSSDAKSIVTLPNLPSNSDTECTPIRRRTIDPYLTATPYNRAHQTGRKYLCARCIDVGLLCCWISFNIQQLQAAHLVPRCLETLKYRQHLDYLRRAIGGRFSVNSRVNYLLLHQPIHTSFDNQGAIIYPIQPHVLDAVGEYLKWLDLQDGGEPWVNREEELVDYFKFLRSDHPLLSDGHCYAIRFTALKVEEAVDIIMYREYSEFGQLPDIDIVVRPPYPRLSTRKAFTNPIFLLLNLIHQFEKTFTHESIHDLEVWSNRTKEQWKDWIGRSSKLKHLVGQQDLDPLTNEVYCSVDGLARALVVAGHLRCRLPQEFQWVAEKNDLDDDSDIFSNPSTPYPPSQDGSSSAQREQGPHTPRGEKLIMPWGSSSGSDSMANTKSGGKRKERTDCTAMVTEWREQNSKPPSPLWHKLKSSWQPKANVDGPEWSRDGVALTTTGQGAGDAGVSVRGRVGSILKMIVNRVF